MHIYLHSSPTTSSHPPSKTSMLSSLLSSMKCYKKLNSTFRTTKLHLKINSNSLNTSSSTSQLKPTTRLSSCSPNSFSTLKPFTINGSMMKSPLSKINLIWSSLKTANFKPKSNNFMISQIRLMISSLMNKTSGSNSRITAGPLRRNFPSLNSNTKKRSIPTTNWSPAWKTLTARSRLQNNPNVSLPVKNLSARNNSNMKSQEQLLSNNQTGKWPKKSQSFNFNSDNSRKKTSKWPKQSHPLNFNSTNSRKIS